MSLQARHGTRTTRRVMSWTPEPRHSQLFTVNFRFSRHSCDTSDLTDWTLRCRTAGGRRHCECGPTRSRRGPGSPGGATGRAAPSGPVWSSPRPVRHRSERSAMKPACWGSATYVDCWFTIGPPLLFCREGAHSPPLRCSPLQIYRAVLLLFGGNLLQVPG